jgi:hypothetical protein
MHWSVRHTTICKKYMCKPFQITQSVLKEFFCVEMKSPMLLIRVFMKNIRKCTKEISHDLGCDKNIRSHKVLIRGSPHCWAAVSRAPEFGPEFHDVITMQECGATPDRWRRRQMVLQKLLNKQRACKDIMNSILNVVKCFKSSYFMVGCGIW